MGKTYKFSDLSRSRLETCHPLLQNLFNHVIMTFDCTIACGYRNEEEQNKAFHNGTSQLRYPLSKHNTKPSLAVDVYPFVDGRMVNGDLAGDMDIFKDFVECVKMLALCNKISVKSGSDWKMKDWPHWELKNSF